MQMNNKFVRGARNIYTIIGAILLFIVGGVFLVIGIMSAIKEFNTTNLAFMILGAIAILVGVLMIVATVKSIKRNKPLSEEQIKANEEKFNAGQPQMDNLKDVKLFFHFGGKMNQSFFVEDQNKKTLYECRLIKFNPFAANTFDFVDTSTGYKKTLKIGKVLTSEQNGVLGGFGIITGSRFKIDGVNCWDYLRERGYEIQSHLDGKTLARYDLVKLGNLVASICPANIKDPFNEESNNILRMGKGCYRLHIIDGRLDDVVMAAFIIAQVDIIQ